MTSETRQEPMVNRARMVIPDLAIKAKVARARLDDADARARAAGGDPIPQNAGTMLTAAEEAAYGLSPRTRRTANWWKGTLNDVGYRSLHAASAELAALFTPREVRAALPEAVGRIQGSSLAGSDPRRLAAQQALTRPEIVDAPYLRQLITIGYEVADDAYARVRSFRNVVLFASALVVVIGGAFVAYVMANPDFLPLCFDTVTGTTTTVVCPTSQTVVAAGSSVPASPETPQDIVFVCLLGLLGATLSTTVSLRNIRGTSDPYSVPVALTALKVPTGALTAVIALIAIQAGFVPGLSYLDSQVQIIAYALLFGYAQQVLTGLVDRQGASVLAGVPSRANSSSTGSAAAAAGLLGAAPLAETAAETTDVRTEPAGVEVAGGTQVAEEAKTAEPDPHPNPDDADDDDDADADDDDDDDVDDDDVDVDVDDDHFDDSDMPDLFPQDVEGGGIDDQAGTLEDLPDEPDPDPDDGLDDDEPEDPDDDLDDGLDDEVLPDENPPTTNPGGVTR